MLARSTSPYSATIMRRSRALYACVPLAAALALAGCGSASKISRIGKKSDTMLAHETFDSDNTYSRSYATTPDQVCEAARRALLSQGYVVTRADALVVEGNKNFQPSEEVHEQVQIRVSCVAQASGEAWAFASALQDRYSLKKSNNSASLGLPVGSVSLPFGSSDDSLVKVASRTVQDGNFYKYFFALVQRYLPPPPPKAEAARESKPAPEPAIAPADSRPLQPKPMDDVPPPAQTPDQAAPATPPGDAPPAATPPTTP